ncbi:MAG: hypothetical protein ACRECO_02030 [Xanthobacteraceae bacterium]
MARAKSFKDLVQSHVKRDRKFAEALLREGVDAMLSRQDGSARLHQGDGRIREARRGDRYAAQEPDPHVRPALQPAGQDTLFSVIGYLQKCAGVRLRVAA